MNWRSYPGAPQPGRTICARAEVAGAMTLTLETRQGQFPVLLVETAAGLRAYVNACPHQYLPLDYRGANLLSADGTRLMCSSHGAQFDAASGRGVAGPGLGCALDAIPVHVVDGMVTVAEAD